MSYFHCIVVIMITSNRLKGKSLARAPKKPHLIRPIRLSLACLLIEGKASVPRVWFVVMRLFSPLLQAFWLRRTADQAKDLEILLLRRQLAILARQNPGPQRLSGADTRTQVVLTTRLKAIRGWSMGPLGAVLRLVQPATVFNWPREKVAPQVDQSTAWGSSTPSPGNRTIACTLGTRESGLGPRQTRWRIALHHQRADSHPHAETAGHRLNARPSPFATRAAVDES